jgi:hypothetical protein
MRKTNGNPAGGATFKHVPLGVGGQIIKLSQSTDGSVKTICTDVHGGYVKGPSDKVWRQLFLATSIPTGLQHDDNSWDGNYNDHSGCPDAVVAPSVPSTIYMVYDGYLLKSTDTGATFANTGATRFAFYCNAFNSKSWGHAITVDPNNANVVLYGTQGHSVFYSTNGGTTFTDLVVTAGGNTPGDGYPGVHLTACDPTSTQTGGVRQRWFYTKYGTGVYMSVTGPSGTYTLMSGSPTNPLALFCDSAGTLWCLQYGSGTAVWKWTSAGGWVNLTAAGQLDALAVDPTNTNRVIGSYGGAYKLSTDGGTTWPTIWNSDLGSNPPTQVYREKTVKYMDVGPSKHFHPNANQMQFDNATAGRLVCSHGCGVAYCDIPASSATPLTWFGFGEGVEELVAHTICIPPGGKPLVGVWDMGAFLIDDTTRFINPQKVAHSPSEQWSAQDFEPVIQQPCSSIDYAADNPNWVAFMQHGGWWNDPISKPHMGYSTDGGVTLQPFPTTPPRKPYCNGGGSLAVGNAGNVVVMWNDNATPVYTKDGGTTWSDLPLPGLPANGVEMGFEWQGNGYFLNKFVITYDKAGGAFYLFNYGPSSAPGLLGFWKSTNGDTWTHVYTTAPTSSYVYSIHLRSVPGNAGHLFFTAGGGIADSLKRSTDGGVTWTTCTTNSGQSITYVTDVGFGKAATGKTYPSIYYWGQVNGVYGLYRSDDNLVTSVLLSKKPANGLDYPMVVAGDPNIYGRVYLCMSGNGVIMGDYDFSLNLAP